MSDKKELRVFISSTFRDLMPEREQLIKKTFPRIRAKCRERGVEFTEIDLRWGITDEESRTGKTIRICLEEIGRCPYFIGILGSRYGWVPGTPELEKDEELLKLFPWLKEYSESGKSIVEMEFAHGALHERSRTSLFYAQAQLREQPSEALLGLASRIQASALPYREFESPDELGEQVYNDLVALLDRDFPIAELTALERERAKHEAFAQNRRQSYVANPEYYQIFEQRVNSIGAPLIIWGKSGLGKSALVAYLANEYRRKNPDAFVIEHYVGASENTDSQDVIRHIMMEIKERYHLSDDIPSDDNLLREEFPSWLAKIRDPSSVMRDPEEHERTSDDGPRVSFERLVLFIDALNQLSGIAPEMHWLPDFIPANVRLILSTTEDVPLVELRKRNWKELEIQPLTGSQVQTIARQFLAQYRKQLGFDQLAMLSLDEKTQRPLFLRTMLEELRMHGSHRSLSGQIQHYLESADEADLFQRVLARLEEDHGESTVRAVMSAIWASRFGLSEHEIIRVTGLTRVRLSELLIAMEYHLMQREQLYGFFHHYLREAVTIRYLASDEDKRIAHRSIASYFAEREYGARRRDEEPWQWRAAGDLDALWDAFADPDFFLLFASEEQTYHFIAYLQTFKRERNEALFATLAERMKDDTTIARRLDLARTARVAGYYPSATEILDAVPNKTSLDWKREQAQLLLERHEHQSALPLCEEIVSDIEEQRGQSEDLFNATIDLSTVLNGLGKYAEAEHAIRRALEFGNVASASKRLDAMQNLAAFMLAQQRNDEAIAFWERVIEESTKLFGTTHPSTLAYTVNIGSAFFRVGKSADALMIFNTILPQIKATFGDKHLWYLACLESVGSIHRSLGNFELAKRFYSDLILRGNELYGVHSEKTALYNLFLARTYLEEGDIPIAYKIYTDHLPTLVQGLGAEHPLCVGPIGTFTKIKKMLDIE